MTSAGFEKSKETSPNTDKIQNILTPKVFAEEIKNSEVLVLGIDPDVTSIFIAVDSSSSSSKERIKVTSTNEYYHMCGFNLATQKRTQHQQHNKKSLDLLVNYLSSKQHI